MEILQETLFRRLLARCERVFGNPPPFKTTTLAMVAEKPEKTPPMPAAPDRDGMDF